MSRRHRGVAWTGLTGAQRAADSGRAGAKELGVGARTVERWAMVSAFQPAPIDPDWLCEQYLTRQRSYTDIAAELGVQDLTVIAAARRHHIPSRPPGVHSRPKMLTKLGNDVPRDVRRAVERSLKGWQRLHGFRVAMTFTTIEAAAIHLGAHQPGLVHQFKRLEHDIGGKLYHRSTPRQPMRPTPRGAALLDALNRPDIDALTAPEAEGPSPARRITQCQRR